MTTAMTTASVTASVSSSSGVGSTVVTTTGGTTGSPVAPPVLTGFANSVSFTNEQTNGLTAVPTYYQLYYTVNPTTISFGIVADTGVDGWVSLGWSVSGNMTTNGTISDAVLAWVNAEGTGYVTDFDITGRNPPTIVNCGTLGAVCPDTTQVGCADQTSAISATRIGNYITVQFTRPLIASDVCDIAIKPNMPQFIIYAVGPVISGGVWPYIAQYHTAHTITPYAITFLYTPVATTIPACPPGTLGCPCTVTATCNQGLTCKNAICVTSAASIKTYTLLTLVAMILVLIL